MHKTQGISLNAPANCSKTQVVSDDRLYQIAITKIPRVGAIHARSLISYCGGLRAVFQSSTKKLIRIPGIGPATAAQIRKADVHALANEELAFVHQHDIEILFYLSDDYPKRLSHLPDAPVLIYKKGGANIDHPRQVAIVGTRTPSDRGRAFCENLIRELKAYDVQVISGLAYGIDAVAHRQCVREGMPTIAVLGHGLDRIYPNEHAKLARDLHKNGALITEFSSGVKPDRQHFPMRNRIIAGLADAIVVVESALSGGSMITANFGNAYHRDVFAVPGRTTDELSAGCNLLIKTHAAAMIESAHDIAYLMGWEESEKPESHRASLFPELTPGEQAILTAFGDVDSLHIDFLLHQLKQSYGELAANLLQLELKGLVQPATGSRYQRRKA